MSGIDKWMDEWRRAHEPRARIANVEELEAVIALHRNLLKDLTHRVMRLENGVRNGPLENSMEKQPVAQYPCPYCTFMGKQPWFAGEPSFLNAHSFDTCPHLLRMKSFETVKP